MAQSGYTPILIYASGTATNVPLAANMTSSASGAELALNYADGKLYFKNSSGVVTLLAGSGGGGPAAGSNTQVQYNNGGVFGASSNMTFDGTTLTVAGLSNTGNTTLGNASADTVTVNGTITSNLIFTDNTYDIGASGATRPRTLYLGTSGIAPIFYASTSASSNTGPTSGGVTITSSGVSTGYYSPPITFDISGGGGNARMYTSRLGGSGGVLYTDTMATNGTYYNRVKVSEAGEWTWLNNNVTTGATAMTLTGQNLVVNGQIQSNLEDGLVSTSQNAANNGIYLQVRPYSGQSGYLTFTENAVADRWAIGIQPGDGTLYFRAGQVTGTSVATLSSGGKLALATATIYGNSNLTIPWVNASSPTQAIYNIDTLTAATYRGSFGDIAFKSSSSFANNAAQAFLYLAARNYGSTPGTANDVTEKVGLWIRGFYDNNGAAVPIYIGGYSYNSTVPGIIVNQSTNVGVGATGADPVYRFDVNASVASNYVARIINNSGSTSSDNCLLLQTSTASGARIISAQNSGNEVFSVTGSGLTTIGVAGGNIAATSPLSVQSGITVANGLYTFGQWTTNSAGAVILTANANPANIGVTSYIQFRSGTSGGGGPNEVARIYGDSGVMTVNSSGATGNFNGKVIAGSNGSINSTSYPGASTYDTGISVNQGSAGGTLLFLCSVNSSAGFSTASAVYMLQFAYDGNNTPNVTLVSGSNSWTFGQSGSNTLTVVGPAGNANYAWFGNK